MEEDLKKSEIKMEALNMLLNMLAETGDLRMVFYKKVTDLHSKLFSISIDENVSKETFVQLTNILKQFESTIDDILKEEK